mgnify:CR=1 FL=1
MAHVISDECVSCGSCEDECVDCGACAAQCPTGAISAE